MSPGLPEFKKKKKKKKKKKRPISLLNYDYKAITKVLATSRPQV